MNCSHCGKENKGDAKFCAHCGAPLPGGKRDPAAVLRDSKGKYILKRLIFFGCAIVAGIIGGLLLRGSYPGAGSSMAAVRITERIGSALILILAPILIAFVVSMLTGLARGRTARNVIRLISVILRSLVPFSLSYFFIYFLGIRAQLFPVSGFTSGSSWALPLLSLILPLTGYMMNAAVCHGHKVGFAGSVGAVAAWTADRMVVIVLATVVAENIFSIPGIGILLYHALMQFDMSLVFAAVTFLTVLIYLLKFLMDVIAAAASGGDPAEQVFGVRPREDTAGKILLIAGIICAAVIAAAAMVLPFTTKGSLLNTNAAESFFSPGENAHLLGTDQFGRDFFALLAFGLRNTVVAALCNTILACVLGAGFGLLAGILKGAAAEVFKGIRYVFGYGAPLSVLLLLLVNPGSFILPLFVVTGLYCWGGIADRVSNAVRARKNNPSEKTALLLPAMEQLVQTFCSAVIGIMMISFFGFSPISPGFPTIGSLLAQSSSYLTMNPQSVLWSAAALAILLAAFYLLHAGLSARERNLYENR